MFFSPITERSLKIRTLYVAIYTALILGGITMIVPFIIMLSGSVEPALRFTDSVFFPRYLVNQDALYARYVESKYGGVPDSYRMAISDPAVEFVDLTIPEADPDSLAKWDEFLNSTQIKESLWATGFVRSNRRMPAYYTRQFRQWLMAQHGNNLQELNSALDTQFSKPTAIFPPIIGIAGAALSPTPMVRAFYQYSTTEIPASRKFAWDAGGYYRAVILPRVIGRNIEDFNSRYGTNFASYREVPFTATVPELARDQWMFYVTRILRPEFVDLTGRGRERMEASGVEREEFIRVMAEAEDLRVLSIDRMYAEWAERTHGVQNALIPQEQLDLAAFQQEGTFWKGQFLSMNYYTVFDEVFLYGRAIINTFILVVLSVGGALLINPLAAYALSRFKLRQTYSILLFFLATIAFPAEVTMIPVFLQLKEFNLLNTFGALVLPGLANGFSIFLLKGFFDSLPKELYEAAELDGASEATMFWQITMNLSKPILAVIALGAFVGAYGTFFYALILAPDPNMWTIMVYIFQLRQLVDSPVVYASLIITALPTLLVFIFCQNIILRGIVVPSDK